MKKLCLKLTGALLLSTGLLVAGCASIQTDASGSRVMVSPNKPPKGCKYLGQVVGNQGNFFTGAWTSNRNLEEGSMNDLRNQAGKMGGNYVQLVTNRAGNTGSMHEGTGGMQQTNVTNLGNAYACPEHSFNT
ncbi:MAG: DUF4156 domain-containing protein [Proteobacteria bacterium]|nr:DUF4156 domain-containing protein [Pseudomonadota bacterium]